jgi:cytochrome c5
MTEKEAMPKTTLTQFLTALVGALIPVLIVVVLLVQLFRGISAQHIEAADQKAADAEIAKRLKPVGEVVYAEAGAPAAQPVAAAGGADAAKGKSVFDATCMACHGTGVAGAPKAGDKAAWGPRIAQGTSTLYKHAIGGFTGKTGVMPPKGGNASLSDTDVKAAVDYMVSLSK